MAISNLASVGEGIAIGAYGLVWRGGGDDELESFCTIVGRASSQLVHDFAEVFNLDSCSMQLVNDDKDRPQTDGRLHVGGKDPDHYTRTDVPHLPILCLYAEMIFKFGIGDNGLKYVFEGNVGRID
jgi:hypothetical protein